MPASSTTKRGHRSHDRQGREESPPPLHAHPVAHHRIPPSWPKISATIPSRPPNTGKKNLAGIQRNLATWIKNDDDSRKKQELNLAIAKQYHLYFKNVLNLVGGIVCNTAKANTGVPPYKVLPKARQREAFLWTLKEVKNFTDHADRKAERKDYMAVSYYDQLLEFLIRDLFNSRARVIMAQTLDPKSYTLREYFDDLYGQVFASTIAGRTPTHIEQLLEQTFLNQAEPP